MLEAEGKINKINTKRKNIPQKDKKKLQTFSCLLFFSKFENSMSMCHTDFIFILFCMAVNKLFFFSVEIFFPCRCCSVQVKHQMFFFFFNVCFVFEFLKLSMWCMR